MNSGIKKAIKYLMILGLSLLFRCHRKGAVILMYHSVGGEFSTFSVTVNSFEKQMAYIKRKGFKVIKLRELISKTKNGENIDGFVSLTFDDGYKDNFVSVFPILEKYAFPATVFLVTDFITDKDDGFGLEKGEIGYLSKSNIEKMKKSGLIDFMPHSRSHRSFTRIPFDEAVMEVEFSRKEVEKINTPADILAFPRGKMTDKIIDYLKKGNWLGAVCTDEGVLMTGNDLFRIKRIAVDKETSFLQFKSFFKKSGEFFGKIKNL